MAMSPGTIVGGYRVQRVLGAGGMGTVYLAKHPSLPRMDALKVLSAELSRDPEFRARFEREANLAAGLDHPNIVSVYNRGEEHGQLWIAMQYVDGTDAAAELARDQHAMTPLRALRITTEVGKGLDHAHRRGLLHRDVKPANFLLAKTDSDNEDERVFLTDFGVAKSTDDATELTQTGSFLATIAYAPPEQLSGAALDHRADIYSLACAFYKLLTGQNPYPAAQPAMVMMGHLHEPPPQATKVNPGLPHAIDHVFARALAKNPAERFTTCREFTDAAANALVPGFNPTGHNTSPTYPIQVMPPQHTTDPRTSLSGPGQIYQPPGLAEPTPPKTKNPKRIAALAGAGVLVVALAAGIGVWATSGSGGTDPTPTTPTTSVSAQEPAFQGKTVTLLDVTQPKGFGIYLTGSPQTQFLEKLGFVYNFEYTNTEGEASPKEVSDGYGTLEAPDDSYVVVLRSDPQAGGGGLLGLPYGITSTRAIVVPIDDPSTVAAMRNWTPDSESILREKLVPALKSKIR
ncbi:serine/threonine-protein kinase [Nocardia sp. NPDC059177]|uniref:serine/threonine-protein kinase n=1 Tax=Nocardia sp. NPDC059177 TaxID=3346759 RepID=UPI0036B54A2A